MKRILSIFAVAAIAFTFSACDLLDDLNKDRDTDSEIMIPDDSPSDDDSGKDNNDGGSTDGSGDNPGGGNDDNGGNTGDNTPAMLYTEIVPGDKIEITVAPKGFGSENMSRVFMLKPSDGMEGVKKAILTAVADAGPNACPPMVVGVGIGGTFEKCALLAKKALTRPVNNHSEIPYVKEMEEELLQKINSLGIGPGGLGGTTTALAVNINTYPTHIAGLPVAVNICCHVNRHSVRTL